MLYRLPYKPYDSNNRNQISLHGHFRMAVSPPLTARSATFSPVGPAPRTITSQSESLMPPPFPGLTPDFDNMEHDNANGFRTYSRRGRVVRRDSAAGAVVSLSHSGRSQVGQRQAGSECSRAEDRRREARSLGDLAGRQCAAV